jgi:hypothetical protein
VGLQSGIIFIHFHQHDTFIITRRDKGFELQRAFLIGLHTFGVKLNDFEKLTTLSRTIFEVAHKSDIIHFYPSFAFY